MESHELDKRSLKSLAKIAINARVTFIERAKSVNEQRLKNLEKGLDDAGKLGKKIRNRGSGIRPIPNEIHPSEYKETIPGSHRKRSRTKNKLTLSEKILIVHQVVIQLKPLKQVAKEHRVTASYISLIVQKVKKNPKLLSELTTAAEERTQRMEEIGAAVVDMYKKNEYLNSLKYIQEKL